MLYACSALFVLCFYIPNAFSEDDEIKMTDLLICMDK